MPQTVPGKGEICTDQVGGMKEKKKGLMDVNRVGQRQGRIREVKDGGVTKGRVGSETETNRTGNEDHI